MKILIAASEGVPFCKTGGLADVIGGLPEALARARHHVAVVMPMYRGIDRKTHQLKRLRTVLRVPFAYRIEAASLWQKKINDHLSFYFVDYPSLFDRPGGLYGPQPGTDFPDNDRRFSFYCRAVLEAAKALRFRPDVIHAHDWQTGLVPAYLRKLYGRDDFFRDTAAVFTIHNMAYQGLFPETSFHLTGLPFSEFKLSGLEFWGKMSFMKAGLVYSDVISTVSETYAKEIVGSPDFGFGLEGVLRDRRHRLFGIVNGLDMDVWDPRADTFLAHNYSATSLAKRAANKKELQKAMGVEVNAKKPVIGFVGRLDRQKGLDLLLDAGHRLLKTGAQFAFLGVGDPALQQKLHSFQKHHREQVFVKEGFAEPFAHQIYGGADIFAMPSRYEPCGLGQLIAMRYGALPVVTPTGGLLDTVRDVSEPEGTGFVADALTSSGYTEALGRAVAFFADKPAWKAAQARAMKQDFSWKDRVHHYLDLFDTALRYHDKVSV